MDWMDRLSADLEDLAGFDPVVVLDRVQQSAMSMTGTPCVARWDSDRRIVLSWSVFDYGVIYGGD